MRDPKRFRLVRHNDVSGVSGTGVIADGVEWPDGTVAIRWRGRNASTSIWSSIGKVKRVHGHNGSTEVVWEDDSRYGRN